MLLFQHLQLSAVWVHPSWPPAQYTHTGHFWHNPTRKYRGASNAFISEEQVMGSPVSRKPLTEFIMHNAIVTRRCSTLLKNSKFAVSQFPKTRQTESRGRQTWWSRNQGILIEHQTVRNVMGRGQGGDSRSPGWSDTNSSGSFTYRMWINCQWPTYINPNRQPL